MKIGDQVEKFGGDSYFKGEVRGVIAKRSGAERIVVEDDRGLLMTYNESQLRLTVPAGPHCKATFAPPHVCPFWGEERECSGCENWVVPTNVAPSTPAGEAPRKPVCVCGHPHGEDGLCHASFDNERSYLPVKCGCTTFRPAPGKEPKP